MLKIKSNFTKSLFPSFCLLLSSSFICFYPTNSISKAGKNQPSDSSVIKVKRIWDKSIRNALLTIPNDGKAHPGVILLHGSEGGSARSLVFMATQLAYEGYAVMSYCYFNCWKKPGEPSDTLGSIELKDIHRDIATFKKSKYVSKRFAIYGHSRGAELALILASTLDPNHAPDALIAHAPSDVYVGIYNSDWKNQKCWVPKNLRTDRESIQKKNLRWNPRCGGKSPNQVYNSPDWRKKSAWNLNGKNIAQNKRIEIEKYKNPLMITHGTKDRIWAVERTQRIEATLKAAGLNPEIHYFKDAPHSFTGHDEMKRTALLFDFLRRHLKEE